MAKNTAIMHTDLVDLVQLLSDEEASVELTEANASFMQNPTVVWAKFILTDDRKNANSQRIPKEEFANLMRSGIHMPVKMAMGEIEQGHKNSRPLGVITHLKEVSLENGASGIVALAALWGEERPSDVTYIRDRFKNNEPVNVSWEILFGDASFNSADSSMELRDTVLRAATIVGEPAYEGRTQFLAVAAKKWSKAYIESLPDSSFLYVDGEKRLIPVMDEKGAVDRTRLIDALSELGELNLPTNVLKEKKTILLRMKEKFEAGAGVEEVSREFSSGFNPNLEERKLDTIEELKARLEEVEAKLTAAMEAATAKETAIAEREVSLAAKDAEIVALTEKVSSLEAELTPLKEMKASADAEIQRKEKLDAIKTKFTDAGIAKDDIYFEQNAETLTALSDDSLTFMIQELKSFAEEVNNATASVKKTKIPVLTNTEDVTDLDPKSLGRALREAKAKK